MVEAQGRMETNTIMAYMLIAGLIGFGIDRILLLFETTILKWKDA
jgi:ABC-type nitrate/sulfonate/bicarbonate transport system permease component